MRVNLTCAACGRGFLAFPYQAAKGRRFCSKDCAPPPPRRPHHKVAVRCHTCGIGFLVWPYRARQRRRFFCSNTCRGVPLVRREPRPCAVCGALFTPEKSQEEAGQGKYCSIACRSVAVRNMANYGRFGFRYRQWRDAVKTRDRQTCRHCGATGVQMDAHHVKSWWRHVALRFDVSNGVTLCGPCHDTLHGITPH